MLRGGACSRYAEPMSQPKDLSTAVAEHPSTCGAAYIDGAGNVRTLGNTNQLELADLFERAAGMLRAQVDPNATTLD
jgi:hypothetical protein